MKWLWIIALAIMFQVYADEGKVSSERGDTILYGAIGMEHLHSAFKEHFNLSGESKERFVGYLEFKDEYPITESIYLYVKHALEYFKEKKAVFVIVHLNSLGGEIVPTIKISDLFQKLDVNEGIPLIAFVDKRAVASAAMLAYACRFIAVIKEAVMGGAENSFPDNQKVWEVPEAYLPYLLNEYANLASLYGRDPMLAEAMVDPSIIIVERDNRPMRLYSLDEVNHEGVTPDIVLATDTTLLSLNAQQLISYGIADFEINTEDSFFPSEAQKKAGKWPFSLSFLSKEPYLKTFSDAQVLAYKHWTISLLLFLTHPALAAVLIIGILVPLYLQIKSERFNLFGFIGFACLAILFATSFALQAISIVDVIFLALGVVLIMIDIARKTSARGIVGFLGIGFTIASLIMLMLPGFEKFSLLDFESSSFIARSLLERILWLTGALIVALAAILVMRKHYLHTAKTSKFAIRNEIFKEKELDFLEKFEDSTLPKEGSEGIAHCSLRPLGKVVIRDKIYDAISENEIMILKKSRIVVVKHHLGKLVVKQIAHIDHH